MISLNRNKRWIVLFCCLLPATIACTSNGDKAEKNNVKTSEDNFPKQIGYTNDFAKLLSTTEITKLDNILIAYEEQTTNEIAIITMNSIQDYADIRSYANDIANHWGVGKKGKNNGLLILIDNNSRNIAISTGLGTEKTLTDEICKMIIDSTIIPALKKGEFYLSLEKGIQEIKLNWK